jgi:hypothetical protein
MNYNKTTLEKYELFKRLLTRWRYLPRSVVMEIADKHEVQEEVLNRVRAEELNRRLKELNAERNTKPNGLEQQIFI